MGTDGRKKRNKKFNKVEKDRRNTKQCIQVKNKTVFIQDTCDQQHREKHHVCMESRNMWIDGQLRKWMLMIAFFEVDKLVVKEVVDVNICIPCE